MERHEVCAGLCCFGGTNSGQQHGVVHAEHDCAIGLLGQFAGFDADGASIGQRNGFGYHVHRMICLKDFSVYLVKIAQK